MFADGMWAKPKYTSFFLFSQRCFLCLFKCSNFCSVFISYLMLWTKHEKEVSHHEWQLSQWVGGWFGLTWLQLQMTTRVQGGCVHDVSASFSLCTVSGSNSSWGGCACLYQTYVDMFESKLHANLMMKSQGITKITTKVLMAIHPIIVELFHSGLLWWTDQPTVTSCLSVFLFLPVFFRLDQRLRLRALAAFWGSAMEIEMTQPPSLFRDFSDKYPTNGGMFELGLAAKMSSVRSHF